MKEYTIYDVADMMGVCAETVRRWIRSGKLPATLTSKKGGYLISEQNLFRFARYNLKYLRRLKETGEITEPINQEPYKVILRKELNEL